MPRIRQKAEEYAQTDFLKEVESRCVWAGLKNNEDLANKVGVSAGTIGNIKRDPGRLRVDILREMIRQLKLNPSIVLCFLGYSSKDIRKWAKEYLQ